MNLENPNLNDQAAVAPQAESNELALIENFLAGREQLRNQRQGAAPQSATGTDGPVNPSAPAEDSTANDGGELTPEGNDESVGMVDPAGSDDSAAEDEGENTDESLTDAQPSNVIDFFDFAEANPDAKFRIKNGKAEGGYVEIDAKKAAALLGQGGAIHENSRKLDAERAAFEEEANQKRTHMDNLLLAMEFTLEPKLNQAYDDLITAHGYIEEAKRLKRDTTDEGELADLDASIKQNQRFIDNQKKFIADNRPRLEQFRRERTEQVQKILEQSRHSFQDPELKNKVYYQDLSDRLEREWTSGQGSLLPGVRNKDALMADEYLLGLVRDGYKYRDGNKVAKSSKPSGKPANSTAPKSKPVTVVQSRNATLQQQAANGNKAAQRDLLSQYMSSMANRKR